MAASAPPARSDFGTAQLLLADSRLAFVALNEVRYRVLTSLFGVSREQANLLTLVLVLTAGERGFETAGRVMRAPLRVSGMDAVIGAFLFREGAAGIAGPSASEVSPFATLLGIVIVGGIAIPKTRRLAQQLRAAERRLRELRESQYAGARRAMARARAQ